MYFSVLLLVIVGFVICFPLTALLIRFGHRSGALDSHGASGHSKALRPIPNIGGIAICTSVVIPLAAGLFAIWLAPEDLIQKWIPALIDHIPRIKESTPTAIAMLCGMFALHVIGIIDDRHSLGAIPKLACQIVIASVVTTWFDVRLLTILGDVPSIVITVLWIVAIVNAINFMDNMDGLAGGVAAVAATIFMIATIINAQWFIAGTLALLIGGLIGFLVFNAPPAKIFMGDCGSLPIGFLLAVLTARTTFYDPSQSDYALGNAWYGVFMPLIVLAIPLYDLAAVTIIRLFQGKNPMVGDQQHFSHRLVQRGLSERAAVVMICGATAITSIGGISLGHLEPWQALLVGVQTLLVFMIIAMLEIASRKSGRRID